MKKTARTEMKVNVLTLQVGEVFWFSGYWVTVTRIENGRVYGNWPHSPVGSKGTCMFYLPNNFVEERLVTLKVKV